VEALREGARVVAAIDEPAVEVLLLN
jgi:hypothetical protein